MSILDGTALHEALTGCLVAAGLTRTRRGQAQMRISNDLAAGITLVLRKITPDISVVDIYGKIVWEEVERLAAKVEGRHVKASSMVTLSKYLVPGEKFTFNRNEDSTHELKRFQSYIRNTAIPQIIRMADKSAIEEDVCSGLIDRSLAPRPDLALSIKIVAHGREAASFFFKHTHPKVPDPAVQSWMAEFWSAYVDMVDSDSAS